MNPYLVIVSLGIMNADTQPEGDSITRYCMLVTFIVAEPHDLR